jgi:hypothetical protein
MEFSNELFKSITAFDKFLQPLNEARRPRWNAAKKKTSPAGRGVDWSNG